MIDYAASASSRSTPAASAASRRKRVADYAARAGRHLRQPHLHVAPGPQRLAPALRRVWNATRVCEYPVELKSLAWDITNDHILLQSDGTIRLPEASGLGIAQPCRAAAIPGGCRDSGWRAHAVSDPATRGLKGATAYLSTLERFAITRFQFPRGRVIGDLQVRSDTHYLGALELVSSSGQVGLGFFLALFHPLPPQNELERVFATEHWPALAQQNPSALLNRLSRPRGGNIRPNFFAQAIDQALWDLQAKELGMPLYQLLGGKRNRVPAYASGLEFRLPIEAACAFYAQAKARGFSAFKLKIGHPDLAWDLGASANRRCGGSRCAADGRRERGLVAERGDPASVRLSRRRLPDLLDRGPVPARRLRGTGARGPGSAVTHINTGEYLDMHGKRMSWNIAPSTS